MPILTSLHNIIGSDVRLPSSLCPKLCKFSSFRPRTFRDPLISFWFHRQRNVLQNTKSIQFSSQCSILFILLLMKFDLTNVQIFASARKFILPLNHIYFAPKPYSSRSEILAFTNYSISFCLSEAS